MTRFTAVDGTKGGVRYLLDNQDKPLIIVSRHGLGDNVFFSPCFKLLARLFNPIWFVSCVNSYATIFHDSPYVKPLYIGGTNDNTLSLMNVPDYIGHMTDFKLDLGVPEAMVYHYGLFEPDESYANQLSFVKGRRNMTEFDFHKLYPDDVPDAFSVPKYELYPDKMTVDYTHSMLDRWLEGRELIVIARHGHTDVDKNLGDGVTATVLLAKKIESIFPGRFKYISLDYKPCPNTAEGHMPNMRSVCGFLPGDASAQYGILSKATLLITVPTGPMLVGAAVPDLKLLTLWTFQNPYNFLDPQNGSVVDAMVTDYSGKEDFMRKWPEEAREAVRSRFNITTGPVTVDKVAIRACEMLS